MYALGVALSAVFVIGGFASVIGSLTSIIDDDVEKNTLVLWLSAFIVCLPASIYCILTVMQIGPPS